MGECSHCCAACTGSSCTQKVPIFATLPPADQQQLSGLIRHRAYKKGERILCEGSQPDFILILNEGSAKAFTYTPDGREQILYIFSQGDFFGEQYLLYGQKAAFHVEALSPVKACMIAKQDFEDLLKSPNDIAIKIIAELGHRLSRLESSLQSMGVRSVDARIGSTLLDFAEKFGTAQSDGIHILLPLSREGMANYLGIARETVSRKLSQLESAEILRSLSNKEILLLNKEALVELTANE